MYKTNKVVALAENRKAMDKGGHSFGIMVINRLFGSKKNRNEKSVVDICDSTLEKDNKTPVVGVLNV